MSSFSKTRVGAHSSRQRKTPYLLTTSLLSFLHGIAVLVALIPYAWILGIIGLAIRARLFLGYWPSPSHPDPKILPFEFHHAMLWDIFECLKWSPAIFAGVYLFSRILLKDKIWRAALRIYAFGWGIIAVMVLLPYVNFVMWFLD